MVIQQGDVWWAELPAPTGSGPGFRRPVVVVQGNPSENAGAGRIIARLFQFTLRYDW